MSTDLPKSANTIAERHRSVPIKDTIQSVPGYPSKLVIFMLRASPFYWVRYYAEGKILKRSTKTSQKSEAIKFAKKFYEEILLRQSRLLPSNTFQLYEKEDLVDVLLEKNSARRKRQKKLDIRVIIGNPPYSAGQTRVIRAAELSTKTYLETEADVDAFVDKLKADLLAAVRSGQIARIQ